VAEDADKKLYFETQFEKVVKQIARMLSHLVIMWS
jgi:hypothetical protein